MYLIQITTTYDGMQHDYAFNETLNGAIEKLGALILNEHPDLIEDEDYQDDWLSNPLEYNIVDDYNIEDDGISFECWFRYSDGDIYATIVDVSEDI